MKGTLKGCEMTDHKLTIFIDGRTALPVRAIPYVTGWHRFSPVPLVRYLAQEDGLLTGYALRDDKPVAVPASDWDRVLRTLVGFEAQAAEGSAGDFAWLEQVVSKLPAGIFVWLDEFSRLISGGRHALSAGFKALWNETFDESYADTYEKPWQDDPQYAEQGWTRPAPLDDDDLILDPLLMDDATRAMVLEGFKVQVTGELPVVIAAPKDANHTATVAGVNVPRKRSQRKTWWDVSLDYLIQTLNAAHYANTKDFYNALHRKAGTDSPFEQGTGANRGSLFVRDIGKALTLKTLENRMPDIRQAAKAG